MQLVKVMESSASALQSLNAQIGGPERVGTTMDHLREQMSATDELTAILSESTGDAVDEREIDDELEALEMEQKKEEEEKQRRKEEAREAAKAQKELDELPSVPTEDAERIGAQSPTRATGIANLSLGN